MHIQAMTKVRRPAPANDAVQILETVAAVMTTIATILLAATGIVEAVKNM